MRRHSLIAVLIERIAAGQVCTRPYKPRAAKPGTVRKPRPEIPSESWLPRMRAWIRRMAPEMGPAAEDMSRLLQEPEMKAMVLGFPQMARAWVPLLNAVCEAKARVVAPTPAAAPQTPTVRTARAKTRPGCRDPGSGRGLAGPSTPAPAASAAMVGELLTPG